MVFEWGHQLAGERVFVSEFQWEMPSVLVIVESVPYSKIAL